METKEGVARQLWLNYFNQALYRTGTITQREYRAMARMIYGRREKP